MVSWDVGKEDGQELYLISDNKMILAYRLYTPIACVKFIVWWSMLIHYLQVTKPQQIIFNDRSMTLLLRYV